MRPGDMYSSFSCCSYWWWKSENCIGSWPDCYVSLWLIDKAYNNLKLLYPFRLIFSIKLKSTLCKAMVLSVFNYYSTTYGTCLDVVEQPILVAILFYSYLPFPYSINSITGSINTISISCGSDKLLCSLIYHLTKINNRKSYPRNNLFRLFTNPIK